MLLANRLDTHGGTLIVLSNSQKLKLTAKANCIEIFKFPRSLTTSVTCCWKSSEAALGSLRPKSASGYVK